MSTARVLVVDDEPAVLGLVKNALSLRGYEVHAVSNPMRAWELAQAAPCFDLVVSDVIMPEMCGPELVKKISHLCPTTAVIVMSAQIAVVEDLPRHARFISKPFRVVDLYSVVEEALAHLTPLPAAE